MKTEGFNLKWLANRSISLLSKRGPVVLQQFAQSRQFIFSNALSCNLFVVISRSVGLIFFILSSF